METSIVLKRNNYSHMKLNALHKIARLRGIKVGIVDKDKIIKVLQTFDNQVQFTLS